MELTADQRRAIADHVRLLLAWNQAINLTAIRDPEEIARLHVLDSLSATPILAARRARRLIDLGSGGGFPGLPLAIALDASALLVDSVGKKAAFLQAAAAAVRPAALAATAARAEALAAQPGHRGSWPAVTARAVAPLAELVELGFPLLAVGGTLVAWKRGALEKEIRAGRAAVAALGGGELQIVEPWRAGLPGHCLVVVRKAGPTGREWPRDPTVRRRRPW